MPDTQPPQVPGSPTIDQAKSLGQGTTQGVNIFDLEKRVSALESKMSSSPAGATGSTMEAALAGVIGHTIAGARKADESIKKDAKTASDQAMDWFETVREKYFPQPKITSSLNNATQGVPYSATVAARGNTPPYAWAARGNFPPGLTLDPTGVISGTPAAAGTFAFTLVAFDATKPTPKALTQDVSMVVAPAKVVPAPAPTPPPPPPAKAPTP